MRTLHVLRLAIATEVADDATPPNTVARQRHVERVVAMSDAADLLERIAQRHPDVVREMVG